MAWLEWVVGRSGQRSGRCGTERGPLARCRAIWFRNDAWHRERWTTCRPAPRLPQRPSIILDRQRQSRQPGSWTLIIRPLAFSLLPSYFRCIPWDGAAFFPSPFQISNLQFEMSQSAARSTRSAGLW